MYICSFFVLSGKQGSGTGLIAGEVLTFKHTVTIFKHVSHIHVCVNVTEGCYTATKLRYIDAVYLNAKLNTSALNHNSVYIYFYTYINRMVTQETEDFTPQESYA